MNNTAESDQPLVFSYLELRKAIGVLGIGLPFVLSIGAAIIFRTGIQSSISAYYHTGMGDVFVGILCVIGFFLFSYRGYRHERCDNIAGNLACVFAVGVALFPVAPDEGATSCAGIVGWVHIAFAMLFFSTLTYFSLFLFTKTDPQKEPKPRKLLRNKIYKACGYTMGSCIVLIAVYFFLQDTLASHLKAYNPIFWLEALAILAFGISWFTKGEAILGD